MIAVVFGVAVDKSKNSKQTKLRVGAVLSSGGMRGVYAHTGFLLALDKMSLELKAMAGCSAGAIVGGIYASGTPVNEWAEALSKITPKQFWTPSLFRMFSSFVFRKGRGYTGLSSTKSAMEFCYRHLKAKTFEECNIPFYTLAKNLFHGCKTVFHSGELTPRIAASAAVPLMYEPVEIDQQLYCDGALLELSPTDAICCKHQLDVLIIHHVARRDTTQLGVQQILKQPWSMVEIFNMLLFQQRPWYLSESPITFKQCPCGCDAIIIVIEPELQELLWPTVDTGIQVLNAARIQAEELLQPYLADIINNKSRLMEYVKNSNTSSEIKNGCGMMSASQ